MLKSINKAIALGLAFLYCFLPSELIAQASRGKEQVIPPSPNAAALGKYGDIPVSLHTGIPNISIPIYQLKEGSLTFPISLSYHSNGIKVAETASWVGLGWALNAGGMITRSVMHIPDEGKNTVSGYGYPASQTTNGYYNIGYTLPPDIPISQDPEKVTIAPEKEVFSRAAKGIIDSEPDIFFYNFNGYSGKFMFKVWKNASGQLERKPVFIPEADIKVEVNNWPFDSFTLTTPDGVKYYFGESGAKESSVSSNIVDQQNNNLDKVTSSWYLTRIVSPEGRTINLEYADQEEFLFADLAPERYIAPFNGTDFCNSNAKKVVYTTVKGRRLTRIVGSNIEIQFKAETTRADLAANTGLQDSPADSPDLSAKYPNAYAVRPKRLDKIIIQSMLSTTDNPSYKQFDFGYDYFVASAEFGASIEGGNGLSTDRKRLKLVSLTEKSITGQSLPAYEFFYNSSPLSRRVSTMQDTYGYYNSRMKSTLINSGACGITGSNSADLFNPNESIKGGILTSIKYPTGGTSAFNYQLHQPIAGGVRIASIINDDGFGNTKTKTYEYENGMVVSRPIYEYNIYWQRFASAFWKPYPTISYTSEDTPLFQIFSSASVFPMQTTQGSSIGYPIVTVREIGNGYTRYIYDLSYSYNNDTYPIISHSTNAMSSYFNGSSSGYPVNYSQLFTYKWRPALFKFNRGNLLIESHFNEQDQLLEETINTYETINYEAFTENNIVQATKVESFIKSETNEEFIMFSHYPIFSGISRQTKREYKVLDYGSGIYNLSTTEYTYGSPNHLLVTEISQSTSSGEEIVEKTKYSFDFENDLALTSGNTAGIRNLVANHVLVPIENYKYRQNTDGTNKRVIASSLTTYKEDLCLPAEIKSLQSPVPIPLLAEADNPTPVFQTATINQNGFVSDSRYASQMTMESYDQAGNIGQLNKANDINQAYLWGYKKSYPIVEIQNAFNLFSEVPVFLIGTITYAPNETTTKEATFTTTRTNTIELKIGFSGDPGSSEARVAFDYNLSGPVTKNGTLCVGYNCSFSSTISFPDMPAGKYTLTVYYNYNDAVNQVNFSYYYPGTEINSSAEFYYEGFEDDNNASTARSKTGKRCNYGRDFTVSYSKPNTRNYLISWQQWDGSKWVLNEEVYSGAKSFSSITYVDDIRVLPSDARMTTYTYEPLVGMTSSTDANNVTTYFHYDSFGRLLLVKDDRGNIVKSYKYNYRKDFNLP